MRICYFFLCCILGVCMRKWLNDSPLWSTFLVKEQEVKVSLVIFLIQKCSKVNQSLLTSSKFFLCGDFTSVSSFALRDGVIADDNFSGAPWVTKFGKLSIPENLVMTQRTSVRPYGLSGQWKVVRMDSWGRGKQRFFGGKSHGATSCNYIAQLVLKKRKQVERVRARRRRENYSETRWQAERDRARMNRQRQREREIQRQRERQQNNDMMKESVVLMSLWPRAINILISN